MKVTCPYGYRFQWRPYLTISLLFCAVNSPCTDWVSSRTPVSATSVKYWLSPLPGFLSSSVKSKTLLGAYRKQPKLSKDAFLFFKFSIVSTILKNCNVGLYWFILNQLWEKLVACWIVQIFWAQHILNNVGEVSSTRKKWIILTGFELSGLKYTNRYLKVLLLKHLLQ